MSRHLFINLPVADVAASREFFARLGFEFNDKFCDGQTALMVFSDFGFVMLMERERFSDFVYRPIPDADETTAHTIAVSAESREEVDQLAEAAWNAGAVAAEDPQDYGFMYQRSFYDLDGHPWVVTWMDPVAVAKGPAEFMAEAGERS